MVRNLPTALGEWEVQYTHHKHDLLSEFYIPVLSNTINYDRITGYFRSSVLSAVSKGYEAFCDHPESKLRLIVGLEMTEDFHNRVLFREDPGRVDEEIKQIIEKELSKKDMPDFEKSRLAGLSWMLTNNKLEVKFGVMLDKKTKQPLQWEWSKLHHKIASFTDECTPPNSATIIGSINETAAAWTLNGDSFETNLSWSDGSREQSKVEATNGLFDEIWRTEGFNNDLNVGIFTIANLSDKWKRIIPPIHPRDTDAWPGYEIPEDESYGEEIESDDNPRWTHQKTAVELFLQDKDASIVEPPMPAGKQGILCMATGTGKTRTALKIVKKLFESGEIEKVIITTHKVDLLDQWAKELQDPRRGLIHLIDYEYSHYRGTNESTNFLYTKGKMSLLIGRGAFQELLSNATDEQLSKSLLIVDECHNFRGDGARALLDGNYQKIPYRLGLSATPDNEYSEEATQFLYNEIGHLYFEFDLLDAIKNGILCPFNYFPKEYMPTATEEQTVGEIKRKYEGAKKKNPKEAQSIVKRMRQEMAKVYKRSVGKLPVFESLLENKSILKRCIIFGPLKEFNVEITNFLNQVQTKYGTRWTTYYGETDSDNLDWYRDGDVEVLLTCKAISEGMDLDVSNIVLLSSDGPKLETIQRIGRALRTHGDDTKVANVYDFVRSNADESSDTRRRDWLAELSSEGIKSRSIIVEEE